MKARKKTRLTVFDIGRLPVTPVANKSGWESKAELKARWEREEREKAEAPIKAILAETSAAVAATQRVIGAYWSQSVEEIKKDCQQNEAAVDTLFTVPAIRNWFTVEDMQSAFTRWYEEEMPKGAYTLTNKGEGGPRLFLYSVVAVKRLGCDFSNPAAYAAAFDRLRELEAFQPGEVTFDPSKVPVEQPLEKPRLSERAQVQEDMYEEIYLLFHKWLESLAANFNGFRPSDDDLRLILGTNTVSDDLYKRGLFYRLNLNPLSHKSWDTIRLWMVRQNYWPDSLLTADERLAAEIENSTTPIEHMPTADRFNLISSLELLRR